MIFLTKTNRLQYTFKSVLVTIYNITRERQGIRVHNS